MKRAWESTHLRRWRVSLCLLLAWTAFSGAAASADKVVATVNGEPIYESQVNQSLPQDRFESSLERIKQAKLDRLIAALKTRQFLMKQGVAATEKDVDARVAQLRKTPPSLGCPCCRYKSLDQFLQVNNLPMSEYRDDLRVEIGMARYIQRLWQREYPTKAARQAAVSRERSELLKRYARVYQIFFNTFQPVDQQMPPSTLRAIKKAVADKAWTRLDHREPFARVAMQMSDDQISRGSGGSLGVIDKQTYGEAVAQAIAALKPGQYSRPIKSNYGFHILKWQPITEADLVELIKMDFTRRKTSAIQGIIDKSARVVKL